MKKALLTIDDAPSARMEEKVDFLDALGIRAVWFCTGTNLEARFEAGLYALRRGHHLGNHAYEHPHFSSLAFEEGCEQIRRGDALVAEAYARAGVTRPGKYFRFPYGDKGGEPGTALRSQYQDFLAREGYSPAPREGITYRWYWDLGHANELDWFWTYDSNDWALNRPAPVEGLETLEKLLALMDEDRREEGGAEVGHGLNRPGSDEIVLMHDQERTTGSFKIMIYKLIEKVRFI